MDGDTALQNTGYGRERDMGSRTGIQIVRIIMCAAAAHAAKASSLPISFKHTLQLVFCIRFFVGGVLLLGEFFGKLFAIYVLKLGRTE